MASKEQEQDEEVESAYEDSDSDGETNIIRDRKKIEKHMTNSNRSKLLINVKSSNYNYF